MGHRKQTAHKAETDTAETDTAETHTAETDTADMDTVESATVGVIIVDHGSRREASNLMLEIAAQSFAAQSEWKVVEAAHMELAQPDIATAFRNCVQRGAKRIVVFPYFLSPGRHWSADIPALVQQAAESFPGIPWMVTAPFGLHPGMMTVINDRIAHCLNQNHPAAATPAAKAEQPLGCDVCQDQRTCLWQTHG